MYKWWLVGALVLVCTCAMADDWAWRETYRYLPPASARARSYLTLRYSAYALSVLWTLGGLLLGLKLKLGRKVCDRLRYSPAWAQAILVWITLATFLAVWSLPISAASLTIERAYGFATETAGTWTADRVAEWAVSLLYAPVVLLALVLIRRSPRRWWLWLGILLIPVGLVMTVLYPVLVEPLFNKFQPLRDEGLRRDIAQLASRAGVHNPQTLVVDASRRTRKTNAYVIGLGPTHRVVLWDTLLRTRRRDEILAVVAHELGHYALNHIWWDFVLESLGGIVLLFLLAQALSASSARYREHLGVRSLQDPAVIPAAYLILYLLLIAQTPIEAAISRRMERQADAYGLSLFPNPDATARALARFAAENYTDPDPPKWVVYGFASHPPLRERVRAALEHAGSPRPTR